jgi:hypothetical protein
VQLVAAVELLFVVAPCVLGQKTLCRCRRLKISIRPVASVWTTSTNRSASRTPQQHRYPRVVPPVGPDPARALAGWPACTPSATRASSTPGTPARLITSDAPPPAFRPGQGNAGRKPPPPASPPRPDQACPLRHRPPLTSAPQLHEDPHVGWWPYGSGSGSGSGSGCGCGAPRLGSGKSARLPPPVSASMTSIRIAAHRRNSGASTG